MGFLSEPLSFLSIGPTRSFAGFSGYVTINENTVDELEITQQPVQQGASISDHAFKKPIELSIQILFQSDLILGNDLATIYNNLLNLQIPQPTPPAAFVGPLPASGVPPAQPAGPAALQVVTVTTPKRTYKNMVAKMIKCTTDKNTENILSIGITFQEVITVSVGLTDVPASQLKNPSSNAATQTVGNKQSSLYTGSQIFGLNK